MTTREIKGWHVFAVTAAAFSVIIAVNVTLAVKAIGTFPGLEVKNSYVASQSFDARRAAQNALGWDVAATVEDGVLRVALTEASGAPVSPAEISAMVGRPTVAREDQTLDLAYGNGVWKAPVEMGQGAWVLKLSATSADGVAFDKRIDLWVR